VAVHSLLMCEENSREETPDVPDTEADTFLRQERARLGVIAVMVASQEVTSGVVSEDAEASVD
jgi:hypothetical protein